MRNALSRDDMEAVDARLGPPVATALRSRHQRAELQASQLRRLRRHAVAPVITTPYLPAHAIGPDEIELLATTLARRLP